MGFLGIGNIQCFDPNRGFMGVYFIILNKLHTFVDELFLYVMFHNEKQTLKTKNNYSIFLSIESWVNLATVPNN